MEVRVPPSEMKIPACPFKLALFDLDGTLTQERSAWEYLHRRLGVWAGNAERYQEAFLRGEITYDRFCRLDAAIWKGMRVRDVQRMLEEIPLHAGVEHLLEYLRGRGIKLGIISSGLSLLSGLLARKLGFDYEVANELGETDGILNGEIKINVHYDRKGEWVQDAQARFQADRGEVLAFGDSSGDLVLFEMAGLSVAFNAVSEKLIFAATLCAPSNDLRDLIPVLEPYLRHNGQKS
jgi:phosphoserine phosphatase